MHGRGDGGALLKPATGAARGPAWVAPAGIVMAVAYFGGLGWSMDHASYDVWGALLLAPVLVLLTVPLARRAARREEDRTMVVLIVSAIVLKLVGSYVRYLVAFDLYDGVADAAAYHEWGVRVSETIRGGSWDLDVGRDATSTGFIRLFTGYVYAVIGPTKLGGFFVFSWLGFWGQYFFYRAFRVGVPEGDGRRYAKLVFFLPSLLFWPSAIGKEAWMTLALGLVAYGAAKLLTQQRGALVPLTLGLWATSVVRSHVAVLALGALVLGYLLRRSRRRSSLAPMVKVAGVVALLLVGTLVVGRFEEQFDVEGVSGSSVDEVLSKTEQQTAQGGSQFSSTSGRSITDLPAATIAVLFRPFPHEARNVQALIASIEGTVLLVLAWRSRHRLLAIPRLLRRVPYVAFAAAYTVGFIFAFSTFGNFGILARQRVQLFPFALVLLAVPLATVPARSSAVSSPEEIPR